MKAIIMVAGIGSRISRHIGNRAKCTIDIGGAALIQNTVRELKRKGISKIAVVTGYKADQVEELLRKQKVKFYHNPFYKVTNSIASLWFARDFINNEEDIMLMNGDVFFETKILDEVIKEKMTPVLFADETRSGEDADYKFYYKNNILINFGKDLTTNNITGEYVGIAKISKKTVLQFKKKLEDMIKEQKYDLWWENVLYSMSEEKKVYVRAVNDLFWAEIDYIEDYERILEFQQKGKK